PGSALTVTGALTQTVTAGQTATYSLQLMPGFTGSLTFQCAGLPTAATCQTPPSIPVTSGAAASLKVAIATTANGVAPLDNLFPRSPQLAGPWILPLSTLTMLAGLTTLWALFADQNKSRRYAWAVSFATVLLIAVLAVSGCGGGSATAQSAAVPLPTGPP